MSESTPADPEIDALDLGQVALRAAYALKAACPSVRFTSGRRNVAEQAHAMASNVVSNRQWIVQTYRSTVASRACQAWVDKHPEALLLLDIAAGLLGVLKALPDAELGQISRHLSGEAFDVLPVLIDADQIKAAIRGLEGLDKFLDHEGGLCRWHAQFNPLPVTTTTLPAVV